MNANPNYLLHSRTPLMLAVKMQNFKLVRFLVKRGALINVNDSLGNNALMIASTGHKLNIVKFLVRNGAALNHRNRKGLNARDFAIRSDNKLISAYLKNVFERNLPDYFDGPYIQYAGKWRIKVSYLKHDSLKKKSEHIMKFFKLKELKNPLQGFAGDNNVYTIKTSFEKPPAEVSNVKKLLIIGDVHGQYDTLKRFLINNGVVDKSLRWNFGSGTVVFIGDIFDRGEKVTDALWLIYRMEQEAARQGGSVHLLLGNHELMVMQGDERYISEKYFYLFRNMRMNYSRQYSNKSLLGKWLRSRNTFLKIDSFLFVHGGLHPNILQYKLSLDSMNNLVSSYLSAKRKTSYTHNHLLGFLLSYNGPFWYRGMVEESDEAQVTNETVNELLTAYNVKHIVVGHTFKSEVKTFCDGKIIATDVPFYLPDGFPMQALLLENHNFVLLNSKGERKEFFLNH